jgi:hypothetical protein
MFEQLVSKIARFVKNHVAPEDAVFMAYPNAELKTRCLEQLSLTSEPVEIKAGYLVTEGIHCLTSLVDTIGILLEMQRRPDATVEQFVSSFTHLT